MAEEKILPCIKFSTTSQKGLDHVHTYLNVRGSTLEECRKHFDEILRGVKDE
jgi:hypothetical protein